jgi:acyl carrier protein
MSEMVPTAQLKRVLPKVLSIAVDVFQVPESEMGPASSPDTVASWDSLHHLSFVLALEQEFAIEFSPEEIEQLLTIELAVALLEEKIKEKEGGASNGC